MSGIIDDDAFRTAKIALTGLSRRSDMISQNLANIDTPGYKAETVNFETAVKRALQGSGSLSLSTTKAGHLAAPADTQAFISGFRQGGSERADGNNVDSNVELTQLTETGVRYAALTQLVNKKFSLLKTIAAAGR
jgi:flagellar basal-body rod protein FlgB